MTFILENIPLTLQTAGSLCVAYAALRVHHRVLAEHAIDDKVLRSMHFEQFIGWTGVLFLIIGYVAGVSGL